MNTYLLLPAFNEEQALSLLLPRVLDVLPASHVIVVDDGSTDRTAFVAREFGVTVIQHPRNLGLSGAIRTLFTHAARISRPGDVLVTMDSDNTMDPAQIRLLLERIRAGASIVIASRFTGGSERGVPPLRRLYSRGARFLFTLLYPISGVKDYTCGFRAYDAELIQNYLSDYPDIFESAGFTAQTEMLFNLSRYRPKIEEVPLDLRYDLKSGASKMDVSRTIRDYLLLAILTKKIQRGWKPSENRGVNASRA